MSATIGHPAALKRLAAAHPEASKAKAVAMVTIPSTSIWAGAKGIERGTSYVLALFPTRLVLLQPGRRRTPQTLLAEFPRKSYRIADVGQDLLNLTFAVVLPYGQMQVRMGRRGPWAVNEQVLEALVASAATAERSSQGRAPLQAAGDVGVETATAVAEAEARGRDDLILAAFPDRVLLLDRTHTNHVPTTPVAQFDKGARPVSVVDEGRKHVDLTFGEDAVRIRRYGEDRIDGMVLDAVLAMNG